MPVLALRLAGPMQSWGLQSNFDTRRTDTLPTKSGVIGLLASALGRQRGDNLEDLCRLKMGIRIDQPGKLMKDYHLARKQTTPSKMEVWVTNRWYLEDAAFLVTLESDDDSLLTSIDNALKHPKYPLFLGRRGCPITLPVTLGISAGDSTERLKDEDWLAPEFMRKKLDSKLQIYQEGQSGISVRRKKDLPLSFSPEHRKFGYTHLAFQGVIDKGTDAQNNSLPKKRIAAGSEHDPMQLLED